MYIIYIGYSLVLDERSPLTGQIFTQSIVWISCMYSLQITGIVQKSLQVVLRSEMKAAMGSLFEVHSDSKPKRQAEKQTWPCSEQDERAANDQTLHMHN